jgi:uncharacterized protein (DUF2252 family)
VSVAERAAAGKAARAEAPRSEHGEWRPAPGREHPLTILERQAASRVQELVPIRYGRMAASPFAFFRGAAAVMAADLAATPVSGIRVQACGDAHLANFGVFAAPDRRLVFDLNDFDETLPGPWEWDLKRLAASFEIAARGNGLKRKQRDKVLAALAEQYRDSIRGFGRTRYLDVWYARLDEDTLRSLLRDAAPAALAARAERTAAKARSKDSLRALDKLTHTVDGELQIVSRPPLIVPLGELLDGETEKQARALLLDVLERYKATLRDDRRRLLDSYELRHIAHKVVGVGSVGTRAWIILLTGRDDQDPLFLQAKEAQASVLEPHLEPSEFDNHGQRVVEGQWLMQAAGDSFLGWCPVVGIDHESRDFYVRQLWDGKGSGDVENMDPAAFEIYAKLCGWTLARAHARSGDGAAIGGYLGSGDGFDEALAEFSRRYADQNESDHGALVSEIDAGRIAVENA